MMMPPTMLMKVMSTPAMASPRTNFAAPSMEPKKLLSASRSRRRVRASFSSIRPAERSASTAICLPGMASRLKRAETSAMRPEPLVMTMKFTMIRMPKTMIPITKLPPMTKLPKASITWPAASGPSCPLARMSRVEARLRASRSIVAISNTVGKELKSSGRLMNNTVIRISTEKAMEIASEMSSIQLGIGRMSTTRMQAMPSASMMSPCFSRSEMRPRAGIPEPGVVAGRLPPSCSLVSVIG